MARSTTVRMSAPEWSPLALGLFAWFDADHAASFTFSSGSVVSQWADRSGNGHHVSQATGSSQPSRNATINGVSAVAFDGTDDALVATVTSGPAAYTVLAVTNRTSDAAGDDVVVSFRANGNGTPILAQLNVAPADNRYRTLDHRNDGGTLTRLQQAVAWGTGISLMVGRKNGATMQMWNGGGTAIATTSSASTGSVTVDRLGVGNEPTGLGAPWAGTIGEIILCNSAISDTDLNTAGQYLADKWGLTWTDI